MVVSSLILLTGCTNDETIETIQTDAIEFGNTFVEYSFINNPNLRNRSISNNLDSESLKIDGFAVWGSSVNKDKRRKRLLTHEKMTYYDGWDYQNTAYWVQGLTYDFQAVAPFTHKNWDISESQGRITQINFTNTETDQEDLLYAEKRSIVARECNNNSIDFSFSHLLSRVKFSFQNGLSEPTHKIQVTDIKIKNAYRNGIYDMSNWTNLENENLALNFGDAIKCSETRNNFETFISPSEKSESSNSLLLIPSPSSKSYEISFHVELHLSEIDIRHYDIESTISDVELKKGVSYNFKAILDENSLNLHRIDFDVNNIEGWKD